MTTRIGEFEVVGEVGRGGMGVILEVRRPGDPRRLALKRIEGPADQETLLRFAREAELLARVKHPHAVQIHSFVPSGPAAPYLVTDLIEGEDLVEVRRRGPLEPRRAARIVCELADAVSALHAADLIHRDLKPANVMLRRDGSAVVIDFGLAYDLAAARLTATGVLVGTPSYMAPEQISSGGRQIDERTDVYGLGAILFFLLYGRDPYTGRGVQVARAVVEEDPSFPSPAERPEQIPVPLEAICRQAMAKLPVRRYRNPAELRADLQRFLDDEAVRADPGRRSALPLRADWLLPLVACLAVLLLIVTAASTLGSAPVSPPPDPAPQLSVTVSADPSPSPRPEGVAEAGRALDRLLALTDPPSREAVAELALWVRANPEHPRLAQARERLQRLGQRFPLVTLHPEAAGERWGYLLAAPAEQVIAARAEGFDLLDLAASWEVRALPPLQISASSAACDPQRGLLYAASGSAVTVLSLREGGPAPRVLAGSRQELGTPWSAAVSPNGQLLALSYQLLRVWHLRVLDAVTGEELWCKSADVPVSRVAFDPGARGIVSLSEGRDMNVGHVWLWDLGGGGGRLLPGALSHKGTAMVFEPGGSRLAVGDNAGAVHLFDLDHLDQPPVPMQGGGSDRNPLARGIHPTVVSGMAGTRDAGDWVLYTCCGIRSNLPRLNELAVWRLSPGGGQREVRRIRDLPHRPAQLALTADGAWLVVRLQDGGLEVWDARALARE